MTQALHADARDRAAVTHFGVHLTIDCYRGSPERLSDGEHIRAFQQVPGAEVVGTAPGADARQSRLSSNCRRCHVYVGV